MNNTNNNNDPETVFDTLPNEVLAHIFEILDFNGNVDDDAMSICAGW